MVATTRVGGGEEVAAEFGKVNGTAVWLDRLFWILIGLHVWNFVLGVLTFGTRAVVWAGFYGCGFDAKAHSAAIPVIAFTAVQLVAFVASAAFCRWLVLCKGHLLGQWFSQVLRRRTGFVLTFIGYYFLLSAWSLLMAGAHGWIRNVMGPEGYAQFIAPSNWSAGIAHLITTGALVWLTLLLARKRLRLAAD